MSSVVSGGIYVSRHDWTFRRCCPRMWWFILRNCCGPCIIIILFTIYLIKKDKHGCSQFIHSFTPSIKPSDIKTWPPVLLYRLIEAVFATSLPVSTDMRQVVPSAESLLLDFCQISGVTCHQMRWNKTSKYIKMWEPCSLSNTNKNCDTLPLGINAQNKGVNHTCKRYFGIGTKTMLAS